MTRNISGTSLGRVAFVAALACTVAACATTSAARSSAPVDQRAQQRWQLLVEGKFSEAYDYLSPGAQQLQTRDAYATSLAVRPMKWLSAQAGEVNCPDGESFCDVTTLVEFSIPSNLPSVGRVNAKSPVTERWVQMDGTWYLVPSDVSKR